VKVSIGLGVTNAVALWTTLKEEMGVVERHAIPEAL